MLDAASAVQREHVFRQGDAVIACYQVQEIDGIETRIYAPGRVCLSAARVR